MNNKIINFVAFAAGAIIGSVSTWQYIKKKYQQIAQEEIDSVKEVFSNKKVENTNVDKIKTESTARNKANEAKEKPGVVEYTSRLRDHGYINYSNINENKKEVEKDTMVTNKPYVIEPEKFGENDDYEEITLIYYSDRVLTDDDDEFVEDIDNVVGFESLNHFGEFEEDSVFVRNDRLKCDYEILFDQRNFSDFAKRKPHEVDD